MTQDLDGRIALVSGSLGGIGREICRLLAASGATVIGVDIAERAEEWLPEFEDKCTYRQLDVTNEAAWRETAVVVRREYGALDVLVHNAGVVVVDRIEDTSLAAWRHQMAVNVEGPFLGTKAFAGLLRETANDRPSGTSIIMVSSIAGLVGTPFTSGYSASKGAVRLLAKSAALEFSALGYGVRVNSVHPGVVETAMVDRIRARYVEAGLYASVDEARKRQAKPMGRNATPNDIAKAVLFLASDNSAYINGTELVVDGGYTAS